MIIGYPALLWTAGTWYLHWPGDGAAPACFWVLIYTSVWIVYPHLHFQFIMCFHIVCYTVVCTVQKV